MMVSTSASTLRLLAHNAWSTVILGRHPKEVALRQTNLRGKHEKSHRAPSRARMTSISVATAAHHGDAGPQRREGHVGRREALYLAPAGMVLAATGRANAAPQVLHLKTSSYTTYQSLDYEKRHEEPTSAPQVFVANEGHMKH
eukprot:505850-Prorocentrum_minimum.AAC.1